MRWIVLASLVLTGSITFGAGADDAGNQFFESKIRPILAERCYSCHSATAKKLKAELYLDSREGILKGGESGPSLVAGHPEQSKLIEAIGYKNVDLQMPPKDKLPDDQIADLTKWVAMGAPWPAGTSTGGSNPAPATTPPAFNLQQRKADHWAWQPMKLVDPPPVKNAAWVRDPVDQFILAGLESHQMHPAPAADRRALLRRMTFDITGLPPTPAEVDAYLNDASPDATAKVIDRLLASPRFGERWARHWLDLARYAETLGHEFDYVLPNAWRYRDYVIRALNADVPYDQFVMEQIAGDLLPKPRLNAAEGINESVIGTGFLYFGESVHSPVDVRQNQADLIDNRIDVTGKAIFGMTIACARCHDHKFDAIAAADYYAMYGLFESTRYAQVMINRPAVLEAAGRLEIQQAEVCKRVAEVWKGRATNVAAYLMATTGHPAANRHLNPALLAKWQAALKDPAVQNSSHPMHGWLALAAGNKANPKTVEPAVREGDIEIADFSDGSLCDWRPDGVAFGTNSTTPGQFVLGSSADHPITTIFAGRSVSSARVSRRLEGTLRSPSFTIDRSHLFVYAAGQDARINVCVEGLNIIRAPIYGGIKKVLKSDKPGWVSFDVAMWKGRKAYIEFADSSVLDEGETNHYGPNGWMTIERVVASDEPRPPAAGYPSWNSLLLGAGGEETPQALAERYQQIVLQSLDDWSRADLSHRTDGPARAALLSWIAEHGLLDIAGDKSAADDAAVASLTAAMAHAAQLEKAIPAPLYSPGAADGSGIDEHVFIRGSYHNLGLQVPRRLLTSLGGTAPPQTCKGSGRLEFARQLVQPENPLVSRVIVNRVWHHLFGRGIVASTDNFGVLGERPSNPQLLDHLALQFVKEGWSIKRLIRELMLTNTYQMASRGDSKFDEVDPSNILLHRMNLRRLEGEAIRDEMLALSGRLDLTIGGPGVDVHLTPFMEGRGKPNSGPVDGNGRRSIYLSVKRNFLSPMLLAFDTPTPFSAMGRRSISNVPAQALILMNDPFVVEMAKMWAAKVSAQTPAAAERITMMYESAFCRPPTEKELAAAQEFVRQQTAAWNGSGESSGDDPRAWADLAHVMMNLKEFIFVN